MTLPLPIYDCYIVEMCNLEIKLISDFTRRPVPFATVDRNRDVIVIDTDNAGFEGLHDISVEVSIPPFEKPHSSSPIKAVHNCDAKFRVEIGHADVMSSPVRSGYTMNHAAERSSETLGI